MLVDPARLLQVDLVATCNAHCLHCHRQNVVGLENPHYKKNVHIDLQAFKAALKDPSFDQLEEIILSGNYGDPIASDQLLEFLDIVDEVKPELKLIVHSNGGLGSKELWETLGPRLKGRGRFVKFAIDGLKDTNHLYRRGVSWDLVMENAATFIKAGGRAVWMFIIFDHNQHQIEEARELSAKLGFAKFETKPNFASHYNARYQNLTQQERVELLASLPDRHVSEYTVADGKLATLDIVCDSRVNESLFIDHEGNLWPCTYIGGWKHSSEDTKRQHNRERMEDNWEPFYNSIYHHSPSAILNHPIFKTVIEDSWTTSSKTPIHWMCAYKCGKEKCAGKKLSAM
ncbi:radical SAM protein [Bacteriovorax sp. PP10]|uniref:Radical SAM protein n=1 Tax=Bacteriovorax antarcticus TaxID=3088717 RepID=A0ABU5VUX1_9BACT|nr:radical SAM protein [Bacteriovorax sp. PP10]MEA9356838.1 radical SAM protein [Bacteriovorax sp. PP10]